MTTRSHPSRIGLEAVCTRCGETFIPADELDLEHGLTELEEPCGGAGELVGAWYSVDPSSFGEPELDRCSCDGTPGGFEPLCAVHGSEPVEPPAGPWSPERVAIALELVAEAEALGEPIDTEAIAAEGRAWAAAHPAEAAEFRARLHSTIRDALERRAEQEGSR